MTEDGNTCYYRVLVPGQARNCSWTVWSLDAVRRKGKCEQDRGSMYCRQYKAIETKADMHCSRIALDQRQPVPQVGSTRPEAARTAAGQYSTRGSANTIAGQYKARTATVLRVAEAACTIARQYKAE